MSHNLSKRKHAQKALCSLSSKSAVTFLCVVVCALLSSGVPTRAQTFTSPSPASDEETSQTTELADPSSPAEVLKRARVAVERLFQEVGSISCTENVTQSIVDRFDRSMYEEHSLFTYRLAADDSGKSIKFVETRERLQAPFRDPGRAVLLTDGFGNMLLVLHPAYAASYLFSADGEDFVGEVRTFKFHFQSVPQANSPLMLQIRQQNYPVALNGTVWIDPVQAAVVKLVAQSDSGLSEFGLQTMRSEIEYQPVVFENGEQRWMPSQATIDVETSKHHWRNVHRFTAYKTVAAVSALDTK